MVDGPVLDAGSIIVVKTMRAGIDRGKQLALDKLAERGIAVPDGLL